MNLHPVTITTPPGQPWATEVTVAGVKLTSVTRLQLTITPDAVSMVDLTLTPGVIAAHIGAARVVVDDATRDVLKSLGWTPPPTGATL